MSLAPSNKSVRAAATLLAACAALGACARQSASSVESPKPAGTVRVGYVRMSDLVKLHPLYPQLARLDEDMQALALRSSLSGPAAPSADVAKEAKRLQDELDAAAARTKTALADKQKAYAAREQAAIDAALGASAGVAGPGAGAIAGGVAAASQAQAGAARATAQKNFEAYRSALIAQDRASILSLNATLAQRAERTYRAQADQLQKKESDYALLLANEDAGDRLTLRTKLSNLALDDAAREDVKKQLDALDQKEADALGAMKNRDQATLVALQKQLHEQVQAELTKDVAAMRARTIAKIGEREAATRTALVAQVGALGAPAPGGVNVPSGVTPAMRAKLEALHKQFQSDFTKDASQTIAEFQKTRADLTKRYRSLIGADANAQAGANKQLDALQRQRGDLYDQMVAQIGREVRAIAARRGVDVVVSDVVAPAGGVDLTPDAEKDIESLHE
jgi:hypothetical protein